MAAIRAVCPELAKKAETELNEVPSRLPEDLRMLREWIEKQPHLKARTDDQFLTTFLRGSKFSLERAKEKLDMYYTVRTAITELFTDRDPTKSPTMDVIKCGVFLPLPKLVAPDAPRIMLIRPGAYDANKHNIQQVMKVSYLIMDILAVEDDNLAIAGQMGILDLAHVTMSHFLQMTPSFVKKMTMLGQESSPFRQKGFHYVHTPSTFETVFNLFKSFMNEKNQSRVSTNIILKNLMSANVEFLSFSCTFTVIIWKLCMSTFPRRCCLPSTAVKRVLFRTSSTIGRRRLMNTVTISWRRRQSMERRRGSGRENRRTLRVCSVLMDRLGNWKWINLWVG